MKRAGISIEPCERKAVPIKARDSLLGAGFAFTEAGHDSLSLTVSEIVVVPTQRQNSPLEIVIVLTLTGTGFDHCSRLLCRHGRRIHR